MGSNVFGKLRYETGFYTYGLSPYQLKPFKGFLYPGTLKLLKKTINIGAIAAPPLLITYLVKIKAEKLNELEHRKIGQRAELS